MKNRQLIFEENFDSSSELNPEIWNYQIGDKWANNELQCYTDDKQNIFIKDNQLHIVASLNQDQNCKYKSARINTYGKIHFQYGKFVVRAKMPKGKGSWPAIWFLGSSIKDNHVRWPLCGEIDLVEFAGNKPGSISSAIHTEAYNHKINTHKEKRIPLPTASNEFHDYELEWTDQRLTFSIDGNQYMHIKKEENDTNKEWPFDQPYYMIINLAVGGWYGGIVKDEDLPFELIIDSIKVFQ
ncbi:MAG: glycoside hydrolase family 16 protein [Acholeplasmataceae bacterium]|nr:glycoside hydrolase family 16 protein [Acholeplasmataceae bacterium]